MGKLKRNFIKVDKGNHFAKHEKLFAVFVGSDLWLVMVGTIRHQKCSFLYLGRFVEKSTREQKA